MTPAERKRALDYLQKTREDLIRSTQGLSSTQLQYKPGPDRWSVAECLEHITVTEGFILGNINQAVQQAASPSTPSFGDDGLVKMVADRSTHINAPEVLVPTGRWSHERVLAEFGVARGRSSEFAATTATRLREYSFSHPLLGPLDCYQWLLLIGAHGERHRAQAEEVIAGPGFPRAAAAN